MTHHLLKPGWGVQMQKVLLGAAGIAALTLSACASSSADIATSFSSPLLYQGYSCQQIVFEDQAVNSRATQLSGQIDHRATNDKIAVGVGVVLFWPALFFVKGDGAQAAEYGQLKGEHEALQQASAMKGCMVGGGGYASYTPSSASYPPAVQYQPAAAYTPAPVQQVAATPGDQRVIDLKVER